MSRSPVPHDDGMFAEKASIAIAIVIVCCRCVGELFHSPSLGLRNVIPNSTGLLEHTYHAGQLALYLSLVMAGQHTRTPGGIACTDRVSAFLHYVRRSFGSDSEDSACLCGYSSYNRRVA